MPRSRCCAATRLRSTPTTCNARAHEKPLRAIEDAALDLFAHGRLRSPDARLAAIDAVPADAVRAVFARLLDSGLSLAMTGALKRAAGQRARERLSAG
jgi:hypothetical protein